MDKCPRCKLPQEGIYRCQYCGYVLSKYKKTHTKIFRQKLEDIIGALNNVQIVTSNKKSKVRSINNTNEGLKLKDKGGTRSGAERRKLRHMTYGPEKRSDWDRRKGFDRRIQVAKKRRSERRFSLDHRKPYPLHR